MFTSNQKAMLRILAGRPDQTFTMSDLGRRLGKPSGVIQRGLNRLVEAGYIVSRRQANLRLLRFNTAHPHQAAIAVLAGADISPLPADVYASYAYSFAQGKATTAEPPGIYNASSLKVLIIAGPNGAGKTTFAREFLPSEAGCPSFINADFIAHALSPFSPDAAALKAGKLMLGELEERTASRRSVAFETTLSGRGYARRVPRWQAMGFAVKIVFLSLPNVEMALARVAGRVRQGGHPVPEETIRRRFESGRANFDAVYKPFVDAWTLYDNSGPKPVLLEEGER